MAVTLGLYCFIVSMVWPELLTAFDLQAHEAISLRSVQPGPGAASLDNFLKTQFPTEFSEGIQQGINGKQVQEWIAFGSRREDSPFPRVQQHFHDPTKIWTQAGLSSGGDSSVLWSQDSNQSGSVGGGNHSWHDARDSYYRALTWTSVEQREQDWADTFETLGRLIHLVQDAATPSHTRDASLEHPNVRGSQKRLAVVIAQSVKLCEAPRDLGVTPTGHFCKPSLFSPSSSLTSSN